MLTDWILRLRSLFRRGRVEQELDEELSFHLEQLVTSLMRRGLTRDEAVRRARLEFGGIDQVKEEHRDARGIRLVSDLGRDVRYAVRQMLRSPGFASVAVLCLGLGIGVNIAIFSMINAVLFRPMPVTAPERLIKVTRGESAGVSYPDYRDFQNRTRILSGLAAALPMESDLDVDGESDFVVAELVSANYAGVLGVSTSLGRWFADDREPAAVISYAVWDRRFNFSPDVIGRFIRSESQTYAIVGVAPREYTGVFAPFRTDIWVPIRTRPQLAPKLEDRGGLRLMIFGRLPEGTTAAQAGAELNAIDTQLSAEQAVPPSRPEPIVAQVVRGIANSGSRRFGQLLTTLMAGFVGLVLLIACVNVGNLLLVRGALRQREFAVRRALGASRARLFRQLLSESLLLASGGGICGVVLAVWTNKLLERSLPSAGSLFAVRLDLSLDWRAIAFAIVISALTMAVCGLLTARGTSGPGDERHGRRLARVSSKSGGTPLDMGLMSSDPCSKR